jgi:DUF4097 and DUF4098 domain-containing protein YvlB
MMHRQRSTWAGVITGALLALVLTAGAQARAAQVTEEFRRSYPLTADGRVSLSNVNGNVSITAWDRNEVKIDAIKRAETKERLDEAKIVIDAESSAIAIKTEYPHNTWHNDNPASVEYTLSVPRNARLQDIKLVNGSLMVEGTRGDVRAESVNGKVLARGLSSNAQLSTVNGPVEVVFDRLGTGAIEVKSVNGALSATIPSDAKAELTAETMNGHISNDFGLPVSDGNFVGHNLRGTLGEGGPQLTFKNVNGSISIRHAADGKPTSKSTNKLPPSRRRHTEDSVL